MKPKALLIEACDFEAFPVGGQLTYVKQLVGVFGDALALVGVSRGDVPVGRWTQRKLLGHTVPFFSIGNRDPTGKKPRVPGRLSAYLQLRKYQREILSLGVNAAYVHAPETLLAIRDWKLGPVCYHFHGTANPLLNSRYRFAQMLAGKFQNRLMQALRDTTQLILASADRRSVMELQEKNKEFLAGKKMAFFPTRVDTQLFSCKRDPAAAAGPVFVTTGRISRGKGWELTLEAFKIVAGKIPGSRLYFVGDGEDAEILRKRIDAEGLSREVIVTGFKSGAAVAETLNAATVFLMASFSEGWSIAMLEALACGLPVVSTAVSGTAELIAEGRNGFVLKDRNPVAYAERMIEALSLPCPNQDSLAIARQYSVDNLRGELGALWAVLA